MLISILLAALMFAPYLMLRNTLYFPTPKKMLGYIVLSITLGTDPFEMALLTGIVMVIMAMFIIQHEAKANSRDWTSFLSKQTHESLFSQLTH
jgi:hypothetical protein